MYIGVALMFLILNLGMIYLLVYINSKALELLISYLYLRRISRISIKKELVLILLLSIGATLMYAVSYVLVLMSFVKF